MIETLNAQLDYARDELKKDPDDSLMQLRVQELERQLRRAVYDEILSEIRRDNRL